MINDECSAGDGLVRVVCHGVDFGLVSRDAVVMCDGEVLCRIIDKLNQPPEGEGE